MSEATDITLTEEQVRAWVGETALQRSRAYVRQGAILHPRCQGMQLKADCQGSQMQPYRVEVTLGTAGIVAAACNCPVGAGGSCKHVAVLLLTWISNPAAFRAVEDLDTLLERHSKEELIALIRMMIQRYPDLDTLLELAPPASNVGETSPPVNVAAIQRQVQRSLDRYDYDWDSGYAAVSNIDQMLEMARNYAQRQDWRNAASVYQTVARSVLENYEQIHDEEGELAEVVNQCVMGIGDCLAASTDALWREELIDALLEIFYSDIEHGGRGMGDYVPGIISTQATPEERQHVIRWARKLLPAHDDSWSANWRRQVLGGLLLDLEKDQMDDETFLRTCRELRRTDELVTRLLQLGRVDEVAAELLHAHDYDVLLIANRMVEYGYAERAEEIVRAHVPANRNTQLTVWLKERARIRGDLNEELLLTENIFWSYSTLQGYNTIKDVAEQMGQWDAVRAKLLEQLAQQKKYALLTEIYLQEDAVDQAIQTLAHVTMHGSGWGTDPLSIQVARAAQPRYPREAIRIYLEAVQRLINARGRDNYATAAQHLGQVRALYQRLGEAETWQTMIASIRQEQKRLRALQEELTKAGIK